MYHDEQHRVYPGHPLYEWCSQVCHDATNLKNAVRFRQRNIMTGLSKSPDERHPLEQQVIDELEKTIPLMNEAHKNKLIAQAKKKNYPVPERSDIPDKYSMPTSDDPQVNYNIIVGMMTHLNNPDYNTDAFCANACQKTIGIACKDMKSFFSSIKDYALHPEKYSGKPKLPGYLRKGSMTTAVFTADGVHYNDHAGKHGKEGCFSLTLPKAPATLPLGSHLPPGQIKEVRIVPCFGFFIIHLCTDDGLTPPVLSAYSKRIAAIDLGIENLASVVNNCGLTCLIFKGGALKSDNQWYNKEMARIQSEQMEGGEKKFKMTEEAEAITDYRNNRIRDHLLKTSKRIVDWCVENRIDTLVVGLNRGWKDGVELGDKNNQAFVLLPHSYFVNMLKWRCARAGIIFVEIEESYTSKASFLDGDEIPSFGEEKPKGGWKFGGYRSPTTKYYRYEGKDLVEYKVKPRGLYKSRKHGTINSDLNGAANILRKAFPDAFTWEDCCNPNFMKVEILVHPDEIFDRKNRESQIAENPIDCSRSKLRRLKRKHDYKGSPSGVGLCG